ncbi:MAG: bifunctional (p)ppGpp synthetase/guanosine-3',5'-bis(diphosphate) 3'-pyrophosphohydrolase [Pseudomonadota bacterium]
MIRQYELVERIREYNPNTDEAFLNKAYVYAMRAHGSQTRANGDPYFSHPIEVANILTKLKMDDTTIVTALLHDTVEDTTVTKGDIAREFGEEVANLVDGVTKLTKLELADIDEDITENEKQAENFRKLLLAIADDIRVLLVKLADRLHNMRTLGFIKKEEKRIRIARETQELYAPLAGRIGVQFIREELEDLCFRTLNADARDSTVARLEALKKDHPDLVGDIECELEKKLAEKGVTGAHIYGRIKTPYSIYEKMQKQGISFEAIADVIAFRIIVDTIENCYRVLGIIHATWSCVPGRFKDHISVPKRNGYSSVHTTVMIGAHKVEIQIRTQKMHDFAEHGVAAHWGYKQSGADDPQRYGWISEWIDHMKEGGDALELLEYTKMEIFHDKVFCFTPKGRIIRLPRGATAIDFAYAVHSNVGDRCAGVKVNNIRVPLRTCLHNGDTVEIITSPQAMPSGSWEEFARTGKAKSAIRRAVRQQEREQHIKLGKSLTQRAFALFDLEITPENLALIEQHSGIFDTDSFYYELGHGHIKLDEIMRKAFPDLEKNTETDEALKDSKNISIPIAGLLPGVAIHLRSCCSPLPGDRIIGLLKETGGVDVHTIDCSVLEEYEDYPELWIDLRWDTTHDIENKPIYTTRILVEISNEPGALGDVAGLIGRHKGNISNLKAIQRKSDFYRFVVDLDVFDLGHLQSILGVLRDSPHIADIERMREPMES